MKLELFDQVVKNNQHNHITGDLLLDQEGYKIMLLATKCWRIKKETKTCYWRLVGGSMRIQDHVTDDLLYGSRRENHVTDDLLYGSMRRQNRVTCDLLYGSRRQSHVTDNLLYGSESKVCVPCIVHVTFYTKYAERRNTLFSSWCRFDSDLEVAFKGMKYFCDRCDAGSLLDSQCQFYKCTNLGKIIVPSLQANLYR